MVPPDIVVLPKLPLTPNGKIDRAALPSPDTARQGRARGPDSRRAPTGPTETALAAIWSKVLGVADVGADDDFFALGGHSLLVMRVVIGVREALGVELVMRDLFEAPTVAALAERLGSRSGRLETPSSPASGQGRSVLLRPGTGAPLVLFHAIGGGLGVYGPLVDALGLSGPVHGLNGLRDDAPADVETLGRDWADEIERLAPEGDARLIGWSFGGVVAYEAARQLIDRGRPPRAVALIDACLPIRGPGDGFSSDEVWAAFAHVLAADVIGAETLEAVAPPVGDFAALVQRHPRLRAADLVALYGTFARNMQAWAAYRPQAISTPVPMTLIRAADGPDPAAMGRLFPDWAALAGAGSTVTLPGDHVSLLRPPHIAAVAAAIEARADDLRRAG
ncbi:thioesterase domain-containing protein [Methyloraptor flagellatus]|uniref:Thioesterase domain-containing protein n=1 Tax=Methyloraptor flagellatus TaxID=3162530 RepID=A0AAU7XGA5_9HYPH